MLKRNISLSKLKFILYPSCLDPLLIGIVKPVLIKSAKLGLILLIPSLSGSQTR